ncbi:cbb3-type cytochrome oxidase subunit 3 [Billgrantia desiderata]|uniref:Cbb3-type cytochrome c oxidase subunit 3 n=1 Tax=Billgrantia desiderata TaxID=52021 RepID=A0AAW4YQG2_9GAMM|nr:cbb3-type cytochrome c oxidase subunit 3 [Halomonas desiderata]MCE8013622.1 cbb3-type cytochrome c oxidase subunit 3 [Halomonas desiderata]MCE8028388.1 cbb3-type cytochrome c oxidase subunit 3 [Halomonas desiderata]MCE8044826.1 cbb3-type cytochrome c oxidase subunit 3 [Halomonas desiderata]MCE8049396.1 cbb3-type cytochrome c oxidase subunit 3 [Halomonas desiderata]MCE8050200.1 cbb3-type cytochrome c oxidase subunit 3 [Halomonas desiderata]
MDTGTFRGIITGLLIIAFLGITWWAYSRRRKPDFDEAANLPFAEDDEQRNRDSSASQQRSKREQESEADSRQDRGDKNT